MREFFGAHKNSMPTEHIIFLSLYMTKAYVFDRAREKLHKKIFITNSQFYQLWKENFHDVVILRFVRMGKCDTCIELYKLAENISRRNKQKIAKKVQQHNMLHLAIQAFAKSKALLAQQLLHMYAFITFDGKQNSKLPHFASMPKFTQCIQRLKMETICFMNYPQILLDITIS
jgi:hypothetical protein